MAASSSHSKTAPLLKASDANETHLKGPFRFPNEKSLAELLYTSEKLENLDLSFNFLEGDRLTDGDIMRFFADALSVNEKLRFLNLSMTQLEPQDICLISGALHTNRTLIYLNLSASNAGRVGARCLADALMINGNTVGQPPVTTYAESQKIGLKHLILNGFRTDTEGFKFIFEALATNNVLQQLVLSGEHVGPSLRSLDDSLRVNTSLRSLDLSNCTIGERDFLSLADGVYHNNTLKVLNLSSNNLTERSADLLRQILLENTSLEELNLSDNPFGIEGIKHIAEGLSANTTLQKLVLTCSNTYGRDMKKIYDIGPEGINIIADSARHLHYLDISGNTAGVTGANAIAEMLIDNRTMYHLDLSRTSPTDEGVRIISSVLGRRPSTLDDFPPREEGTYNDRLMILKFSYSDISDVGMRYLREAVRRTVTSIWIFNREKARFIEVERDLGIWNSLTRMVGL